MLRIQINCNPLAINRLFLRQYYIEYNQQQEINTSNHPCTHAIFLLTSQLYNPTVVDYNKVDKHTYLINIYQVGGTWIGLRIDWAFGLV